MKNKLLVWVGSMFLLSILLAACGGDAAPAEIAAEFTLPDSEGNMVSLADELAENEQVVLVFYYSWACQPCMKQLKQIVGDYAKYEENGAKVFAIAVNNVLQAKAAAGTLDAPFPVLADADHVAAEAFGVFDTLPEDFGRATPSVFIINQDREITWKHINESFYDEGEEVYKTCGKERVASEVILENLT